VLQDPARRVNSGDDLAVDVVQRLGALRIVDPFGRRPVDHAQRTACLQPCHSVDEGVAVSLAAGVHSQAVDPPRLRGHGIGQLAKRNLAAGAAKRGQRQHQVDVAAPVERALSPGQRRPGGVQRVLRPPQPDCLAGAHQGVAEDFGEVGAQLPGPFADQRQRGLVRIPGRDQRWRCQIRR
jgi:hypothetical protein